MKSITSISVIALCISCLAATALEAVQGRAYVERQREIYKMAKAIEPDRADVRAFGELLEDLDDCDLSESTRDFWRTARSVKAAMEKELAQINERANKDAAAQRKHQVERAVQQAEMLDSATQSTTEPSAERTPLQERAHQMEMVYREAEGLRNPVGMADLSVVKRYRLLAGKFHELMKEDVEAMEAKIERLKEENRRSR
jgi:hypothetical protein